MFRLTINSQKHGEVYKDLATQAEVEAEIFNHDVANPQASFHWGKLAYTEVIAARDAVLDEQGVEIMPATPEQVIEHPATVVFTQEDITAQVNLQNEIETKANQGAAAREACSKVLDYIAGSNLTKNLTVEQINQMQATYSQAESALRAFRPSYAKYFITQIVPDGILVTEAEKAACLLILQKY